MSALRPFRLCRQLKYGSVKPSVDFRTRQMVVLRSRDRNERQSLADSTPVGVYDPIRWFQYKLD